MAHRSPLLLILAVAPANRTSEPGWARGPARVIVRAPSFAAYIDLACSQIRRYGAAEPTVTAALLVMLQDTLALISDPSREQALAGQAQLIVSDAERSTPQPADLLQVRDQAASLPTSEERGP